MALTHNLSDGTTTVQLNDGSAAWTERWGMGQAAPGEEWTVDEHEVELLGGNATVLANQVSLHQLGAQARRFQEAGTRGMGPRVLYSVSLDGSTTYRCEVGGVEFIPGPERVRGEWALGRRRGTLRITRRNWIEGPEAQISLTNVNGTDNTSGLRTQNSNNSMEGAVPAQFVNWFDVTAAKIAGDLPALIRLEGSRPDGAHTQHILVAKHRTTMTSGFDTLHWGDTTGADTVDTARTNDSYKIVSTNASGTGLLTLDSWLAAGANDNLYLRFFLAVNFTTPGVYRLTPEYYQESDAPQYGAPVYVSGTNDWRIYDVGAIKAPKATAGLTNYLSAKINYTVNYPEGGILSIVRTYNVDAWSVCPYSQMRSLSFLTTTLGTTWKDDELDEKETYVYGGTAIYGKATAIGDELTLTPGYGHRFFFYITGMAGDDYVSKYSAFKLYYRPRYLAI
jgi:hypothetical protein